MPPLTAPMTNIRDEKEATEPAGAGSERVEAGDKTAPEAHVDGAPPKLADGIELIGEYQDSGFKEPPSIARRADGQVVQLPAILYSLAEEIDGRRGYEELAERASEKIGRGLSADDTRMLVEEKLVPLGVVAGRTEPAKPPRRSTLCSG